MSESGTSITVDGVVREGGLPILVGYHPNEVSLGTFGAARRAVADEEKTDRATFVDERIYDRLPEGWTAPFVEKWERRGYGHSEFWMYEMSARRDLISPVQHHAFEDEPRDFDSTGRPSRQIALELDLDVAAAMLGGIDATSGDPRRGGAEVVRTVATDDVSLGTKTAAQFLEALPDPTAEGWRSAVRERIERARTWAETLAHAEAYEHHLGADQVSESDPETTDWGPMYEVTTLARPIQPGDAVTARVDGREVLLRATHRVPVESPDLPHFWVLWAGDVESSSHESFSPGDFIAVGAGAVEYVERGETPDPDSVAERTVTAEEVGQRHAAVLAFRRRRDVTLDDASDHVQGLVELVTDSSDPFVREEAGSILYELSQGEYEDDSDPEALLPVVEDLFELVERDPEEVNVRSTLRYLAQFCTEEMLAHADRLAEYSVEYRSRTLAEGVSELADVDPAVVRPYVEEYVAWLVDGDDGRNVDRALAALAEEDPAAVRSHVPSLLSGPNGGRVLRALVESDPAALAGALRAAPPEVAGNVATTYRSIVADVSDRYPEAVLGCVEAVAEDLPVRLNRSAPYARILANAGDVAPELVADAVGDASPRPAVWEELDLSGEDVGVGAYDSYREPLEEEDATVESKAAHREYYDQRGRSWRSIHDSIFEQDCPECGEPLAPVRTGQESGRGLIAEFRCEGSPDHSGDYRWLAQLNSGEWFFVGTVE